MGMYKELDIWKLSIKLVKRIYEITRHFPKDEMYGLSNQMRRAAVSIPSNIAEGSARNSTKENIRFLQFSIGSLAELDTQMIISKELGYINENILEQELVTIGKKLYTFRKFLKNKL